MSPETTDTILKVAKIIGLGLILCFVPFVLAFANAWLESRLAGRDGRPPASLFVVLLCAGFGAVRGFLFSWHRFRESGMDVVTMNFGGPTRTWMDPFRRYVFNIPVDAANLMDSLKPWQVLPFFLSVAYAVYRTPSLSHKLLVIPILATTILFSYLDYVYTAFLTAAILFPALFFLTIMILFFMGISTVGRSSSQS